jgi:hypothetical protein
MFMMQREQLIRQHPMFRGRPLWMDQNSIAK